MWNQIFPNHLVLNIALWCIESWYFYGLLWKGWLPHAAPETTHTSPSSAPSILGTVPVAGLPVNSKHTCTHDHQGTTPYRHTTPRYLRKALHITPSKSVTMSTQLMCNLRDYENIASTTTDICDCFLTLTFDNNIWKQLIEWIDRVTGHVSEVLWSRGDFW